MTEHASTHAQDLFRAGQLDEAIQAMGDEVRSQPSDPDRRGFLSDLLCIQGNFERADIQLEAISRLVPGAIAGVSLVRQLIRAEQWRQQCFHEGRAPEFINKPSPNLQLQLRARLSLREGDSSAATAQLAEAEELRPACAGDSGGEHFEDFRDCDDLSSGFFEVLTSTGKYYWIPTESVISIEMRPLERARDLFWRRAAMEVADGPNGEVFLPAIYAPAPVETAERLGRTTSWSEEEPIRGAGLRTFLVGDEPATLLDLTTIQFDRTPS